MSAGFYAIAWEFGLNLPAYPEGVWYFNPFAWQLLFVFGAWCALGGAERLTVLLNSRVTLAIAIAYLLVAFYVALSWHLPVVHPLVPSWLEEVIYPIDKTNLDVLRFAHFLALATVTVWFIPRDWPPLNSRALYPAILCGQHSLEIFCLGVFLAFAGHFAMVEISGALWMQVVISVVGILDHDRGGRDDCVVQAGRRTPPGRAAKACECGFRGRRGMRLIGRLCASQSSLRQSGSRMTAPAPRSRAPARFRTISFPATTGCGASRPRSRSRSHCGSPWSEPVPRRWRAPTARARPIRRGWRPHWAPVSRVSISRS